jgi:hypothetical protein
LLARVTERGLLLAADAASSRPPRLQWTAIAMLYFAPHPRHAAA